MNDKRKTTVSKYLAKHLRHEPEALGLTLAPGGWVAVADLLTATAKHGFPISPAELGEVVRTNPKRRFSFDDTGKLIRASQGHSTEVDLQLDPTDPPALFFHGTGSQTVPIILADGLLKMLRHHVHLSADIDTARMVGMRHGKPAIFQIDAAATRRDGYTFFMSQNGVWLTDAVPPAHVTLL